MNLKGPPDINQKYQIPGACPYCGDNDKDSTLWEYHKSGGAIKRIYWGCGTKLALYRTAYKYTGFYTYKCIEKGAQSL